MRKIIAALICICLAVSLTACSKSKPDETENSPDKLSNLVGEYLDENGDTGLKIEESGTEYHVEISIFRLTLIDDGKGVMDGDKLIFTATDSSGQPIKGEIVGTEDGADVIFTDSTWAPIQNGDRYSYQSK